MTNWSAGDHVYTNFTIPGLDLAPVRYDYVIDEVADGWVSCYDWMDGGLIIFGDHPLAIGTLSMLQGA